MGKALTGHSVDIDMTNAKATFADPYAQKDKVVTFSGFALKGSDAYLYQLTGQPAPVTADIDKKTLTVTAENKTIQYGDDPANAGVKYDGFVNNEDASALDGELGYEYTYRKGDNAGEYAVTFSGVTPGTTKDKTGNYVVKSATAGTLTIQPAEANLTANSRDTDMYDGTEKTVTGFTCDVDGLEFDGVSAEGKGTDAGSYDVEFTGVTPGVTKDKTGNYVVKSAVPGALTIQPGGVVLTANSRDTDEYDGAEKVVTGYTCSVQGLEFDGVTVEGRGTDAGEYTVNITGVTPGTTKDKTGNYTLTGVVPGTLTIQRRKVGLEWSGETFTYNGAEQGPTATATNLIDGDAVVAHATGATNAGAGHVATASLSGGKADNYKLPDDPTKTFDIAPAAATVTAQDQTKTYGDMDPGLSATVSGLYGADALNYTLTREAGENVGTYAITVAPGDNPNYAVTATGATFTIEKAAPTVEPPTGKTGLIASGAQQELVSAGRAHGGKMVYAITATETAPAEGAYNIRTASAEDPGTYYVWYRVIGDANHLDTEPAYIVVTIEALPEPENPEQSEEGRHSEEPTKPEEPADPQQPQQPEETGPSEPLPDLVIAPESLDTIRVGQKAQLSIYPNDLNLPLTATTWITSDKEVATVKNGEVTGKSPGTALITVRLMIKSFVLASASREITVVDSRMPTAIRFSDGVPTEVCAGDKLPLGDFLIYEPATAAKNKKIKWTSSDKNVAKVTSSGVVTAGKKITQDKEATITATVKSTDISASVRLTVYAPPSDPFTGVTLTREGDEPLGVGESVQLNPVFEPYGVTPKKLKWRTSDRNVATVTDGMVKGKGDGKCTITLNADGMEASMEIEVVDYGRPTGLSFAADAPTRVGINNAVYLDSYLCFEPDTADRGVKWTTSNKNVAKVSANGVVTGKSVGTATITAKCRQKAYQNIKASIDITVFDCNSFELVKSKEGPIGVKESIHIKVNTDPPGAKPKLKWTSSDTRVAKVDKNAIVKGVSAGTATITATNSTGDLSASVEVTVE